jgi:hypothetical protein
MPMHIEFFCLRTDMPKIKGHRGPIRIVVCRIVKDKTKCYDYIDITTVIGNYFIIIPFKPRNGLLIPPCNLKSVLINGMFPPLMAINVESVLTANTPIMTFPYGNRPKFRSIFAGKLYIVFGSDKR